MAVRRQDHARGAPTVQNGGGWRSNRFSVNTYPKMRAALLLLSLAATAVASPRVAMEPDVCGVHCVGHLWEDLGPADPAVVVVRAPCEDLTTRTPCRTARPVLVCVVRASLAVCTPFAAPVACSA
jgi:hypothetical protein